MGEDVSKQKLGRYPPEHLVRFIARWFSGVEDRARVQLLKIACGPRAGAGAVILVGKNPEDAERWRALVEASATPDVYYLPEYACATAEIEQTEAKALVAGASSSRILAPLLIRRMRGALNGSEIEWLDAATPYGYGGILSLSESGGADMPALQQFFEQLQDLCSTEGIVCCVIRLHPLIGQDQWFGPVQGLGNRLCMHGRKITSSIDCADWDEGSDMPKNMDHGRRARLRQAQRALHTTWTPGDDPAIQRSLDIFSALYNERLERLEATGFYRFPPSYYLGLAALGKRMGVVIAWQGDQPVGADIALAGTRYAYGHLSGTNAAGQKNGASTLLNIEEARWARRRGCRLLYLGGGIRPGDGVEKYKRSFGGPSHTYSYLTFVADRERFNSIRAMPDAPWPYNDPGSGVPAGSKQ